MPINASGAIDAKIPMAIALCLGVACISGPVRSCVSFATAALHFVTTGRRFTSSTCHEERMASRDEFLLQLWNEIINKPLSEVWFDNAIRRAAKEPNAPVADLGPVVDRLLSQGVSSRDLSFDLPRCGV